MARDWTEEEDAAAVVTEYDLLLHAVDMIQDDVKLNEDTLQSMRQRILDLNAERTQMQGRIDMLQAELEDTQTDAEVWRGLYHYDRDFYQAGYERARSELVRERAEHEAHRQRWAAEEQHLIGKLIDAVYGGDWDAESVWSLEALVDKAADIIRKVKTPS